MSQFMPIIPKQSPSSVAADGNSNVSPPPRHTVINILIPVFNDWPAACLLLRSISSSLATAQLSAAVLFVDDGSTLSMPSDVGSDSFEAISSVHVLSLRRNVGHQRAICIGLSYLADNEVQHPVVVMDCDGEDNPADIPTLYNEYAKLKSNAIVFASRAKRSESGVFCFFYGLYKQLFWMLTGQSIRFGNFSIIPPLFVRRLAAVSELWNHYAAAVVKSRLPRSCVDTVRATRIVGQSQMNFFSLVLHGLSAMSVFSDIVAVRLMCACLMLALLFAAGLGVVIWIRLLTTLAIPGWATSASGLLCLLFLQALMMSLVFVFVILADRSGDHFMPIRDYRHFILDVRNFYPTALQPTDTNRLTPDA